MASRGRNAVLDKEVVRFDNHQKIQHLVLMITFVLLAFTGLPLKFHDWSVSQWWISVWGGIETTRAIHKFAAFVMVADAAYHLGYITFATLVLKRPFPIKMVPTPRDFALFFQEIRYFMGLRSEPPKWDRFDWRQKFDYWAIFWGLPVIGISGFILMYPVFVTNYLPGWVIPISFVAHGDEAILAVAWIFIVHFFFNHFAPGVFPINTTIFTGRLSKKRYQHEHPVEYERLVGATEES